MRKLALLVLLALPMVAQDVIVAGVIGDSSIVAPIVSWHRGDTLSLSLTGWTIAGEWKRNRTVASFAITPMNAYAGDRIYVDGERVTAAELHASALEASFGRIDKIGKHWTSDVRAVALFDRIENESEPYAGVRTRQSWHHLTAEDPLRLTFDGAEVSATAEVFAGHATWSRIRLDQRFSRRWGRVRAGESVFALYGHELGAVHAFLIGGYGYRYAEFRIDRGVGVDLDLGYAITPTIALTAHAGAMRSRDLDPHGVGLDVTATVKGIALRLGIGTHDRDEVVIYGSILAARFLR
jgi:hypothetical protein